MSVKHCVHGSTSNISYLIYSAIRLACSSYAFMDLREFADVHTALTASWRLLPLPALNRRLRRLKRHLAAKMLHQCKYTARRRKYGKQIRQTAPIGTLNAPNLQQGRRQFAAKGISIGKQAAAFNPYKPVFALRKHLSLNEV